MGQVTVEVLLHVRFWLNHEKHVTGCRFTYADPFRDLPRYNFKTSRVALPGGPERFCKENGGAEGGRTPDLRIANATLSQLSYGPSAAAGDPRTGRKARGSCGGVRRPVKRLSPVQGTEHGGRNAAAPSGTARRRFSIAL